MNDRSRLFWRCRRGIREMDILFQDFIKTKYDQLSETEKQGFDKLLNEADLDIMNWIMGKDKSQSDELNHIVALIRETHNLH